MDNKSLEKLAKKIADSELGKIPKINELELFGDLLYLDLTLEELLLLDELVLSIIEKENNNEH